MKIEPTPVHDGRFTGPEAWRCADFNGADDWTCTLGPEVLAQIEEAVRRRGTALASEDLPALAPIAARLREELDRGRGFVLIRGLPAGRYNDEETTAVYLALGGFLGTALPQNVRGELIYSVRDEGQSIEKQYGMVGVRFSKTTEPLSFHTDSAPVLMGNTPGYIGLLALRTARSGGASALVSAASAHNVLRAERPDLLARLYQPYHFDRRAELRPGESRTLFAPVFTYDGSLAVRYFRFYIPKGHEQAGIPLAEADVEALDFFEAVMNRPELQVHFEMQPGDMQFLNNRRILHSRTSFEDHPEPERRRHLVRLWLKRRAGAPRGSAVTRWCAALLALASLPAPGQELRKKYIALTRSWTEGVIFTPVEREAMERGRRWEPLMTAGLDDPLARKAMERGEPGFESLAALYPGKILDRTVLGSWSDPRRQPGEFDNEFAIWWNGALSANLLKARVNGNVQPQAHNTNLVFRVGPDAEMFGRDRNRYLPPSYEDGHLPVMRASYTSGGVEYGLTAFADKPSPEAAGYDIAWVRFEIANSSGQVRTAELHADTTLADGTEVRHEAGRALDGGGALLFRYSPAAVFDPGLRRLTWKLHLAAGESATVFLKVPYAPDRSGLAGAAGAADFDSAHRRVRSFWNGLLDRGTRIRVPEPRVNNIWRALLAQNFILADGGRFTYGSGLLYNDSYYPVENGFGANMFTRLGHKDYGHALLDYCVPVSVDRKLAGRKYQNRRALPFHHLLEDYRLTGRTDTFERFQHELYRVAEEIVSDRRSTMAEQDGRRPLHYGLLPPDRPGVDLRASTQTVYVLAHNITNAQGLQDFGEFLVRTGLDAARGRRYLEEAADFRRAILRAMEGAAIRVPGRAPFVDLQTLYFRDTPEFGPDPYDHLGTGRLQGTYFHYWVQMLLPFNFFNPGEPPGEWLADYVRQRGGFVLGCTRARPRPEQPYGWINNVYNAGYYNYRLRAGHVEEFLLGFYARLAFGMTRHTWVASEGSPLIGYNTRDGGWVSAEYSFPNSAANAETLSMLRLMLVMEELRDNRETGDLWLLAGTPRAWLEDGKRIEVSGAPTYFGEVSFAVESHVSKGLIRAAVTAPAARRYRAIVLTLRHPRSAPLRRVVVNGAGQAIASGDRIRLPAGPREFRIEAHY